MSFFKRLTFNLFYLGDPPWDSGVSPPELLEFLDGRDPGRAIDLGCGTGTNVITLAQRGWQVTGVDFISRAIRKARKKAKAAGIQADLRVGDVTKLNGIHGPFEFALDLGCFHSLSEAGRGAYLDNLERLLSSGGHWMMYGFIHEASEQEGSGLTQVDIERIQARMKLLSRQDGTDRRERRSAYFLFQKP